MTKKIIEAKSFKARCPGRISLSKHADYINSDLVYLLDDREIQVTAELITDRDDKNFQKLELINDNFENTLLNKEEIKDIDSLDKSKWYFYVVKTLESLDLVKNFGDIGLKLKYTSNLAPGNGLSSSHALILSTICVLSYCFEIKKLCKLFDSEDRIEHKEELLTLIKLCQKIENARGFNSGLGDQSAQLLGKKDHLTFIKLFPDLSTKYQKIPDNLAIISAPSFIKADKSLAEFQAANENIKLYKEVNQVANKYGVEYLADLINKLNDQEIFDFLEKISNKKLQGLALYGLAEAKRVNNLRKIDSQLLTIEDLGKHLNLSHQAEKNFKKIDDKWLARTDEEKMNFLLDSSIKLEEHSGIYLASTQVNDELQELANDIEGVYGSSISGAGLGGSNTIICSKNKAKEVKDILLEKYYKKHGLYEKALNSVHISSSNAAVSLIG